MLMSFGSFVFSVPTLAYGELQRKRGWRHKTSERVGARQAGQFVGPGDDIVTLTGSHVPGVINDRDALRRMADLGDKGDAVPLVDGAGNVFGTYVLESMDETTRVFTDHGVPIRTDFTLSLRRMDEDDGEQTAGWLDFF